MAKPPLANMAHGVLKTLSIGLLGFDNLGCLGFWARSGPKPTHEMQEALDQKYEEIGPIIANAVRRTLPWLLYREVSQ